MSTIDLSTYTTAPHVNAKHAKGVARKIKRNAPPDAAAGARAALHEIELHADRVNAIRDIRERLAFAGLAPSRSIFMQGWGALHDTCAGVARIPAPVSDRGTRAQILFATLFPLGAGFVTDDTLAAWSEADRTLVRIEKQQLRAEIDAVLGPELLAAAEHGTRVLGNAIGVGEQPPAEAPSATALSDALARMREAITSYQMKLAAEIDMNDPASIERFRVAMAPIDEYRARRASARDELEEDDVDAVDVVELAPSAPTKTSGDAPTPVA